MILLATRLVSLALIAGGLSPARAADAPQTVSWPAEIAQRVPFARPGPEGTLEVDAAGPADLSLIEIESPGINQPFFGFRTRIEHQQVAPVGIVQMEAAFGPAEVYFSRQSIDGDAPWRPLELPFNASEPGGGWRQPIHLRLRLILPGGGRVSFGPLEIVQASSWEELSRAPGAWWSAVEAGWIGAIGGVLFGSLGAIVGILVGRGRARGLALMLCWLAAAVAGAVLIAGLIALARDQDYAVYYPLLLIGALGVVMFPFFALRSRRAYASDELRRMRARDA